jgi:hypothetical protein
MRLWLALLVYWCSTVIVMASVVFGADYLARKRYERFDDLVSHFTHWDGRHYTAIAEKGYDYNPSSPSNIAFFPAYPMLGRLASMTGLGSQAALLIVAHLFLVGSFALLASYAKEHASMVLLAFAFWPVTFFLRMTYSESIFIFLALLSMLGIKRGWSPLLVAVVVGAATATRPVSVALLLPLLMYSYRTSRWYKWPLVSLLSVWGLVAFMIWQQVALGTPFAFIQTQENFRLREAIDWPAKLWKLITLEPFRAHFDSSSDGYWGLFQDFNVLFSLRFADPLYLFAAFALVTVGWRKRWLNDYEIALSMGLLFIPYVARGYDFAMASQGRYTAVIFPIYLVLGRLLAVLPQPLPTLLVATSTLFLILYAVLFSAGFSYL